MEVPKLRTGMLCDEQYRKNYYGVTVGKEMGYTPTGHIDISKQIRYQESIMGVFINITDDDVINYILLIDKSKPVLFYGMLVISRFIPVYTKTRYFS